MTQIITLTIEKMISDGRGLGRLDGKPIFVSGVIPGESVRAVVTHEGKGHAEADLIEVTSPSPARIKPPCPYFGECGGCQWQFVDYEEQIKAKHLIVAEQLKRVGKMTNVDIRPVWPSAPYGYRQTVVLQRENGKVGFYKSKSHDIIEWDACPILSPDLQREVDRVKEMPGDGSDRIRVSTTGVNHFVQANKEQNDKMVAYVGEEISRRPRKRLVELFCGDGNFTFSLSPLVDSIIAIDAEESAIALAKEKTKVRGVNNVIWWCGAARTKLAAVREKWSTVDGILLDPPRAGAKECLADMIALTPSWIGYVSCDVATFARDVAWLSQRGYQLDYVQPIDMFPQTPHIEVVGWLRAVDSAVTA